MVWVLRRPEQVPVLTIGLIFLIEDIILLRPIGLWAAVMVIGTEAARKREAGWRELPFMVEWLRVAILMAMMMAGYRFLMAMFFLPLPPLGQVILQYIATIAAYPLVAGLAGWLSACRATAPKVTRGFAERCANRKRKSPKAAARFRGAG
jgi:rod shape-determining protein MreD